MTPMAIVACIFGLLIFTSWIQHNMLALLASSIGIAVTIYVLTGVA